MSVERSDTGLPDRRPEDSGEYRCPECGRQVTVGPSGREYGHERGANETGSQERCPRRPASVDPKRDAPQYDGWVEPGGGTA